MSLITVGVVGCGYWGIRHVRNFHEIPQATLSMAADLSEDRLWEVKTFFPYVATTTKYQDLLESDIGAVVIATPPSTHYQLAKEAMLRGKHVLVEKPLAVNVAQALELATLAEKLQRVLMVGHTYEFHPAVGYLRQLISSGELGQIFYIDAARLNLGLFQPDVNVLWDLAPHDISILMALLAAQPTSVSARGSAHVNPRVPDVAYVELRFPGDVLAHIHVSWLDPSKVRRVTVVGSKKMVVFDDVSDVEKIRIYDKGVSVLATPDEAGRWPVSYRNGNVTIPYIPNQEPLKLECTHFAECAGRGEMAISDGWDGLKVVRILEAAEASLANGGLRQALDGLSTRYTAPLFATGG